MKDWAAICSEQHDYCKAISPSRLPTRVVHVAPDGKIRLHCAGGSYFAYYAILSHPWGPQGPELMTTKSNLSAHMNEINEDDLARNFKDAIRCIRLLGYEYIWIDALCIVQDDGDDWNREASQMAQYYYDSTIMLSADSAQTCNDGFLHNRDGIYSLPMGTYQQFRLREYWSSEEELLSSPINSRAWTFQERFIAPRTLHFLSKEVVWECGHGLMSEGYLQDGSQNYRERGLSRLTLSFVLEEALLYSNKRQQFPGSAAWQEPTSSITQEWCEILHEYTKRSLTYVSDRLSAIAGLARLIQKPRFGRYLAGLWEQDLFHQLCWYRFSNGKPSPTRGNLLASLTGKETQGQVSDQKNVRDTASAPYRAPSWSWAAAEGQIDFPQAVGNPPHRSHPVEQLLHEYSHWVSIYKPRLVGFNMVSQANDNYLRLNEGSYIEVEGYCRYIYSWVSATEEIEMRETEEHIIQDGLDLDVDVDISWSDLQVEDDMSTVTTDLVSQVIIDQDKEALLADLLSKLTFAQPGITHDCHGNAEPPFSQRFVVLQLEKEYFQDRLVWALLLTEHEDEKHGKYYKRIGLISLAHYNLCEFMPTSYNSIKVPTSDVLHPIEREGRRSSTPHGKSRLEARQKAMETDEWSQSKWEKRTLRLM
ncbi:uncharacterized protein PV07_10517 [Cladophialophora immunda]|uniref:Heterokaryon incompatibility domain-containing protein n=1 Tax=Cladophialophora immunda TaxID=569365 RepID=A0A0D2AIU2_9EURO|nr:uncharacterized protein PV07_10517 [Cladophialophora immunda]KIW24827.1 hypothetical protein PV07_10517 [Cladophialophora immunda]